jgi:hypothetical protein
MTLAISWLSRYFLCMAESLDRAVNNLKVTNEMQVALADRFFGFGDDEKRLEWVEKHSKRFREVITNYPELPDLYLQDSDRALEQLEALLYQEQSAG